MSPVHQFLSETAARALPRILTQICRDPGAPFYGSCDRNWWHYKIRDFPSIILQQAGYAIAANLRGRDLQSQSVVDTSCPPLHIQVCSPSDLRPPTSDLLPLAAATARFWNLRALRHGAFEEYYPYEQGYPPVAFATLGTAKICHLGIVPLTDIRPGLAIAARQLLTRFEAQAANQQIAGTAALAVIRSLDPSLIEETRFQKILTQILTLQHAEGWFPEYDGPDLGYLSVSIDCLWDIHDHTGDPRILPAIRKAADYIAWFALSPLGAAGMHNSRNTDYFTPYGLVRLALEEKQPAHIATVEKLFTRPCGAGILPAADATSGKIKNQKSSIGTHQSLSRAFHPFDAVDDRYWCHYIGHSVLRAIALLEIAESADQAPTSGWDLQSQSVAGTSCPRPSASSSLPPVPCSLSSDKSQPGSGHALLTSPAGPTALVSTRKGAITTAIWPDGSIANDFGWIVHTPEKVFVSHWWSNDWTIAIDDRHATCKGYLVPHKEHLSAPWKHIVLRIASFIAGRRLIKLLKRLIIFKKPLYSHHYTREVAWDDNTLVIRDTITGLSSADQITRAPRTSKRHVASADSFHPEDLEILRDCERVEKVERSGNVFRCESRYQCAVDSERLAVEDWNVRST